MFGIQAPLFQSKVAALPLMSLKAFCMAGALSEAPPLISLKSEESLLPSQPEFHLFTTLSWHGSEFDSLLDSKLISLHCLPLEDAENFETHHVRISPA